MQDKNEFSEFGIVTFVYNYHTTCSYKLIKLKLNFGYNLFSAFVSDAFDDNNYIDYTYEREDEGKFEYSESAGKVYFLIEKSTRSIKTNHIECPFNNEGITGYPFVDGYRASDWERNEFVAKNESQTISIPSIYSFKWDEGTIPVMKYLNLQLDFQSYSFIATAYHCTDDNNENSRVYRKDYGSFKLNESNRNIIEFDIISSKIEGRVTRDISGLERLECEYSDDGIKGYPIIDSIDNNDWYANDYLAKTIYYKLIIKPFDITNILSTSTIISSENKLKLSEKSKKIESKLSFKAPTIKLYKWSRGNDEICFNIYLRLNYTTMQYNASTLDKYSYWMNDTRYNLTRIDHGTFIIDESTNIIVFSVEKSEVNGRPSTKKEIIECKIDSEGIHNYPRIEGYFEYDWYDYESVAEEYHLNSEQMCENKCGNLKCPGKSYCCFLCMKNGSEKHGTWCSSNLIGEWTWNHDGTNPNGDLTLLSDYSVTHRCGWDGMSWHKESKDIYKIIFNDVAHIMKYDGKDTLTLERDYDTNFNGKPRSTATRGFTLIPKLVESAKEVKNEVLVQKTIEEKLVDQNLVDQKPIIIYTGKVEFSYSYQSTCSGQLIKVILDFSNNSYVGRASDSFDDCNGIDYYYDRDDEGSFVWIDGYKVIFTVAKSSRTIKSNVIECEVKNDRIIGYPFVDGYISRDWQSNNKALIRKEIN